MHIKILQFFFKQLGQIFIDLILTYALNSWVVGWDNVKVIEVVDWYYERKKS
jgi:hypothetical protein